MVTPKQLKNYLKHDALVLWGTASDGWIRMSACVGGTCIGSGGTR